jgi:hypothetical protein
MRISSGTVKLYHSQLPAMRCKLLDLSETGLRCSMGHEATDDEYVQTGWRRILGSERPFHMEVEAPGDAGRIRLEATVRHLKIEMDNSMVFGVRFERMDINRVMSINKSMDAFAKMGHGMMTGVNQNKRDKVFDPYAGSATCPGADDSANPAPTKPNKPRTAGPLPPVKVAAKTSGHLPAVQMPQKSSDSGRRSVSDVARGLWDSVRSAVTRTPSEAAMKAVPASQSEARLQAVDGAAVNFRGMKVGEILQRLGKLKAKQASEAFEKSSENGQKFGRYLLDNKLVSPADLCRALSLQSGLPIVDLTAVKPPESVKDLVPPELMLQHQFVPFNKSGAVVYIAAVLPITGSPLSKIESACRSKVKVFLAQDDAIAEYLKAYQPEEEIEEAEPAEPA